MQIDVGDTSKRWYVDTVWYDTGSGTGSGSYIPSCFPRKMDIHDLGKEIIKMALFSEKYRLFILLVADQFIREPSINSVSIGIGISGDDSAGTILHWCCERHIAEISIYWAVGRVRIKLLQ